MKKCGILLSLTVLLFYWQNISAQKTDDMVGKKDKIRLIVTSDIGGTDPDDFQSMVHLMVYSDVLDLEGIISSPWGSGRVSHILSVIDAYEKDYPNLKTWSDYPTPDKLRSISKQGAIEVRNDPGWAEPTEGSKWIVECAKRPDPRPLYIANWGAIDDVAQALHDAPEIAEKIRIYWIAGPNRCRNSDGGKGMPSNRYMEREFKKLWWIQTDQAYRGMFNGINLDGEWGNVNFPKTNVIGHGALGAYWTKISKQDLKMGDTPSILFYLNNDVNDPTKEGWGGAFVPAAKSPGAKSSSVICASDVSDGSTTWWRDNPDKSVADAGFVGALTVSKWRKEFLGHWKNRMDWCTAKNPTPYETGTVSDYAKLANANIPLTISTKVTNVLNITYVNFMGKAGVGELFNLSGTSVMKFTLVPNISTHQINIQHVLPGTYMLKISGGATNIVKSLVKVSE